ncbi:carboxypeptidase-like regulatory domain-containing protein [Chitinophaga caeni]|nr:carboxypeptidase-like regulatory domain-containing protein [Chitinophaga caeni]
MKKLIITLILITASTVSLYSQNKTIKGRVISDDFEIVPLALIMINDTVEVGRTDSNGFFQIDIPVSVKKILFRDVGFEQVTIAFVDTCDEVEVVMMLSGTYDFRTLKKVDKLRMKKFKKLPELHREAFEKGIFKTDKACYIQEFIPYYKKKQR